MKKMTKYTPKSNSKKPEAIDLTHNYTPSRTFNPRPSPSMRVFGGDQIKYCFKFNHSAFHLIKDKEIEFKKITPAASDTDDPK